MRTGKLIVNDKKLDSHDIPTDRFYKRMEVWIFETIDKQNISPELVAYFITKYGRFISKAKFCTCHDVFYYCGDCEDDEMPYFIPAKWVIIK